ncbi:MAG: VWA domain-containing protein [Proteobacteria bacterium]|nr:VWA domain-containing protein [Pseudomonadota bacterium]
MRTLRAYLKSFIIGTSGNVALTFALASLPLVGFVGSAIDFSRANAAKAAMQAAVDSTALALSKNADSMSAEQINARASEYFKSIFSRPDVKGIVIKGAYSKTSGSRIVIHGSAAVDTTFMGALGFEHLPISVSSTAAWGINKLRVALALDVTGSMAEDGKMPALKDAAKALLKQLKAAARGPGDIYVSIVPFARYVNIGNSNYNKPFIDWTDWDKQHGTWECAGNSSYNNSHANNCKWKPDDHSKWEGCVSDRGTDYGPSSQNYDQKVLPPNSDASSEYPAEQPDGCPAAIRQLTYDWDGLNDMVGDLRPEGSTNQPIGLVWAWQTLVGGGAMVAPPKDNKYVYSEAIILMSDGLNTQNRWYGNGSSQSVQVDERMYDRSKNGSGTCENAKDAGIIIYTIQVNTGHDPTSKLLQNCASGRDKFTEIKSADQMVAVFESIGSALSKLHLAD